MKTSADIVIRAIVLSMVLVGAVAFADPATSGRDLTIEDRIRALESLERIYQSHQIGDARPFEQAFPRAALERQVRDSLKKSVALERFWNVRITADMLRRETERMARRTMMPERLRELYAAVADDPVLIQECLARPALVDRLARSYFQSDRIIHAPARRRAEAIREGLVRGRIDPSAPHPDRVVLEIARSAEGGAEGDPRAPSGSSRIVVSDDEFEQWNRRMPERTGGIGPLIEERERFVVHVTLDRRPDALRVAVFSIEKENWDRWWKEVGDRLEENAVRAVAEAVPLATPQGRPGRTWDETGAASFSPGDSEGATTTACTTDNTWENGVLDDQPLGRSGHTAVWTGSLMLIWGGWRGFDVSNGSRYDPVTDTWTGISFVNAPTPRSVHTAVWTGSSMVVWGGYDPNGLVNTGGRYDPVTNTWTPTSTVGAPTARYWHTAVWTGTRMVVWGGISSGLENTGGRYDPEADTWETTSVVGAPSAREGHTAVWTGGLMIVWGGESLGTGGRYDPATDAWSPTSTSGAPTGRWDHTAVWTGSLMIVWGGGNNLNTGGRYDPATDRWADTTTNNAPSGRLRHVAVWLPDQGRMMVWGGQELVPLSDPIPLDTGGLYSPANNKWVPLPGANAPSPRVGHTVVWTGSEAVVWGGSGGVDGSTYLNSGARYDPLANAWSPTAVANTPTDRIEHTATWTGNVMIIWGGYDSDQEPNFTLASGGRYDPAIDAWSPTSMTGAPTPRSQHTAVWTGSQMIVWGGLGGSVFNSGGRYDPLTDTWLLTSFSGAPSPRWSHTAVWTGSQMIVWAGIDGTGVLGTGARYDPASDSWTETSMIDAPVPRYRHTAVWTGSRMLIFGGDDSHLNQYNTGGRYDPASNTWTPLSTVGAPAGRSFHSAIWTGKEMVVWGGFSPGLYFNTGGRYDPAADAWTPTSLVNAPPGRYLHAAVWTGRLMVVWSGLGTGVSNTGGRYEPQTDTWTPTTRIGAPVSRQFHTGVWTGTFMIVWGGYGLNDGGRYCVVCTLGTYYRDGDGDGIGDSGAPVEGCSQPIGYVGSGGDCNDADASVSHRPGETGALFFVDDITLSWTPPADPGATSLAYDILRSGDPSNFTTAATCVDSDTSSTTGADGTDPGDREVFYYLVRAENACPDGQGSLGSDSNGVPRQGRACP